MPEYLFCTHHSFSSVDDLKKHLQADMRDFVAIMPEMKAAGLTRAERGIRVDGKGQYITKVYYGSATKTHTKQVWLYLIMQLGTPKYPEKTASKPMSCQMKLHPSI